MKLLFFSDIHGITTNLNKIDEVINNLNPDYIIVLGDLYGRDVDSNNYVYNFLMKYKDKLILTLGNCDVYDPIFIENVRFNLNGVNLFLSHGNEFNYDRNSKIDDCNILVYGHKHIPYIRKKDGTIYICVGSISLPRNDLGPTYMIYDDKFIIYDINDNVIDELSVF